MFLLSWVYFQQLAVEGNIVLCKFYPEFPQMPDVSKTRLIKTKYVWEEELSL